MMNVANLRKSRVHAIVVLMLKLVLALARVNRLYIVAGPELEESLLRQRRIVLRGASLKRKVTMKT
jgi:hypothetical protein